jgi:hypothetical protein
MTRKYSNTSTNRPQLQRVSIRAERRPEPDWDRFAYALLQHVKRISNKDTLHDDDGEREPES